MRLCIRHAVWAQNNAVYTVFYLLRYENFSILLYYLRIVNISRIQGYFCNKHTKSNVTVV